MIPRSPGRTASRPRLLRRLDALMPLTVVRGVVGTGKTTLVAEWARLRREHGYNVVWVRGADTIGSVSVDEFIKGRPELGAAGPLVVVFDDAHHLTDMEQIDRLCDLLVMHPRLHVVVCTSRPHPVSVQARQRGIAMTELTGRDLEARAGELAELAELWGHELSPAGEAELLAATGGWIAPARFALDHRDPVDDPDGLLAAGRYVHEHILPEMMQVVSPLAASTLALAEELSVDLARAVCVGATPRADLLGPHTPEQVLAAYEDRGFLERIPSPSHVPVWRLPVLVRRVLADSFVSEHPQLASRAHQALARHLVNAHKPGDTGQVLGHARAAQDWGVLARTWSEHGLGLLQTHPEAVLAAYGDVPAQMVKRHPVLGLAASVLTSFTSGADPRGRAHAIRRHANVGRGSRSLSRHPMTDMDTGWVGAQIMADRLNGRPDKALGRAELHAQQVATAQRPAGPGADWGWFQLQWGMSALAAGRLATALKIFSQAIESGKSAGVGFLVAAAAGQRALVNAVTGYTQEAARDLATHEAVAVSGSWLRSSVTPAARIATGLLALDRLDPAAVDYFDRLHDDAETLDEWALLVLARAQYALLFGDPMRMLARVSRAEEIRHGLVSPRGMERTALDRTYAELLLALGELNRVERYLQDVPDPQELALAVPRARLALITGDAARARSIALDFSWRHGMLLRDRVDLFMIDASAALELGDRTSASEAFTHAHNLAGSIGSLVPYAYLPREVLWELLAVGGITLPSSDMGAIEACREVYPARGELIRLTAREGAVLQAMAEHETLSEVAAQLSVSINTVKKQSAAIYAKLGVHDRAAALVRAYQLGLVSSSQ